jgi:hypothetical protein
MLPAGLIRFSPPAHQARFLLSRLNSSRCETFGRLKSSESDAWC